MTKPDTKPDANGNYYVKRSDSLGSVEYVRVPEPLLGVAIDAVERATEQFDRRREGESIAFVDAGHGTSCQPGVAIDYDPSYPPASI